MPKPKKSNGSTNFEPVAPPRHQEIVVHISAVLAEAELFMRVLNYRGAHDIYAETLTMQPDNIYLLSCRARCRLLLGNLTGAIVDADRLLRLDPTNSAAYLIKANANYSLSLFEDALIWYHRGLVIRPGGLEFEQGIVRSQMAIEKAIQSADIDRLRQFRILTKENSTAKRRIVETAKPTRPSRKDHNLLDEMFTDYCFLRKLDEDPVMQNAGNEVTSLIREGVVFMENRIEYWRTRNPQAIHDPTAFDYIMTSKPHQLPRKAVIPAIARSAAA